MDKILYHYTDFNSLDGIVNGRELRVNNVLNMNDTKEMDLFISGIFNAVKKRFEDINDEIMVGKLEETMETVSNHYFDISAYAACFSQSRDDAAQWERYANKGKGVCLCFDRSRLEKLMGGAISLQEVIYQSDMTDHPLVDRMFDLLQGKSKLRAGAGLMKLVSEAWRLSAAYKHPSFSSEQEIRLVVMPFGFSSFDLKPKYHVTRERIKKYYPLDLNKMCRDNRVDLEELITEIMVGPESTQSPPILEDYLKDLGLKKLAKSITTSDCPLRSKL